MAAGDPPVAGRGGPVEAVIRLGAGAGSLAIWVIAAIVFYDVTLRFLGRPTLWALEISTYLMIAAAVLASGLAVLEEAHFSVRIVPDRLRPHRRRLLDMAVCAVCLVFLAYVTYGFAQLALLSYRFEMLSATLLEIPLVVPQGVACLGFLLMVLAFARCLVLICRRRNV